MRCCFTPFSRMIAAAAFGTLLFGSNEASAQKLLGANVHQSIDVGHDATEAASLGWVRIDLNWFQCEPTQGNYDFALLDQVVDAAVARNLKVLAVIGYGPSWASSADPMGDGSINDVPIDGTYPAFVTAVVNHFQDRVSHYELWNEPNLEQFFEGSISDYTTRILVPGAAAVHSACPSCKVVAPGLASIGSEYDQWLDASLAAAKDQIDIVSGHIYAGFPVDSPGSGSTSDSFFNKLDSHRILETGGTVVYEGPLSFREVMDKHGVNKPFWLTETGREATLGNAEEEAAQTLYYRRVIEAMLVRDWWEQTIFYEAFDEPNTGYEWGLVLHDPAAPNGYQAKPVVGFLKNAVAVVPGLGGKGPACNDGLDDDGDGLSDYPEDPDCTSVLDPDESGPLGRGTGGSGGAGGGGSGGSTGGAAGGGSGGFAGNPEKPADCSCGVYASHNEDFTWIGGVGVLAAAFGSRLRRKRTQKMCTQNGR
ncbi:MAG: beta-galactosidase [Polyangiaceae bacterium]|nr:beta-galactosidase [Polyangiaceae bacterium]